MGKFDGRVKALERMIRADEYIPGIYEKNMDGTYTGLHGEVLTEKQFQALEGPVIVDDICWMMEQMGNGKI